jgi:hypothetical protein
MKHDLHLMYKFTDRGGNLVYEKYLDSDRIERKNPMGELRLTGHFTTNISEVTGEEDGYRDDIDEYDSGEEVGDEFKPVSDVQGGGTG